MARLPGRSRRPYFAKEDFHIDFEADTCACPAGNVAVGSRAWGTRTDHAGCTVQLHPQEGLFQKARALQGSPAFAQYCQLRVVVEHRLARLVQLGIRQARYFGRPKTKFKLDLAATVANLTLMADKMA